MRFFQEFFVRLRGSEFAKNTAILSLGTILSQGIFIASVPILSRLYRPEDFGLLAVFLAISTIVATVVTLRYETAILIPKKEAESVTLVLLGLSLTISVGLLWILLVWVLPDSIRIVLGIALLGEWSVIAVLLGLMTALIAVGTSWYNRQKAYINIVRVRIFLSSLTAVIAVLMGISGFYFGMLLAQVVATTLVAMFVLYSLRSFLNGWQSSAFVAVAKEHGGAPKYLLPAAILDVVTLQLPILLITAWFSSNASGQYSMAWKVLALPMALFGAAIGQVFFQKFSEVWPDANAAEALLIKTWKLLIIIGIIPTILIMIFGEYLFAFVLGDAWKDAGRMAMFLAPMLLAILVSSPTSTTYLVLGMQRFSLVFGIASLIYRPLCLYLGWVNESLFFGLLLLVSAEVLQIIIYQYLAIKRIRRSI